MSKCTCNKIRDKPLSGTIPQPSTSEVGVSCAPEEVLQIGVLEIPQYLYRAIEVMNGRYGNGKERVELLEAMGLNANTVQKIVNDISVYWE